QRGGQVVRGGRVVRLRGRGGAEQLDRFVELPLLQEDLAQVHFRGRVLRIDLEHTAKRRRGIVDPVVTAGNQAEYERRLRTIRQCGDGGARFGVRLIEMAP